MALNSQNVELLFNTAITTKSVDESKQFSDLITAKNVQFNSDLCIESKTGFERLASSQDLGLKHILPYKGSFIAANHQFAYSYSEPLDLFTAIGGIASLGIKSEGIYKPVNVSVTQQNISVLTNRNLACITWIESGVGGRYALYDLETKSFILPPTTFDANATDIKSVPVTSSSSFLIFVYRSGTTAIVAYQLSATTLTLGSATSYATDVRSANLAWDVTPYLNNSGATLAYAVNGTNYVKLLHVTSANVLGTTSNGYYNSTTLSYAAGKAITVRRVDTDLVLAYSDNATPANIKAVYLGSDFSLTSSLISVGSMTGSSSANNITLIKSATGVATIFVDEVNATFRYGKLWKGTATKSGSSGSLSHVFTGVMLASKAFYNSNDTPCVICIHKSNEQSTYFALDAESKINARFSQGVAGDNSVTAQLQGLAEVPELTGKAVCALLNRGKILSQAGVFYALSGIVLIDLEKETMLSSAEFNDGLYISGGSPRYYDGLSITEAGFSLYPEGLTLNTSATTGGNISNGTYGYKAVFEFYDNQGRVFESKTSTAIQVTAAGGTSTQTLTIRIPVVQITERTKFIVALYRTTNNGTIYYRVTSITSPDVVTALTGTYVDIVDTLADATIQSNQQLYTTGNILDNGAFPSANIVKLVGGRLWLGACENRRNLYYCKTANQFQGISPASEFSYDTVDGGDVIALAEYSQSLTIFKQSGIYVVNGVPAVNTGANSSLQPIRRVSSKVSALSQSGVAETPFGIFFVSPSGVKIYSSGAQGVSIQDIGQPISLTITPADVNKIEYIERTQQVRVHTDTVCMVRDMELNTWYEWTNSGALDCLVSNGYEYFIKTDGYVRREIDEYSEDGAPIQYTIRSGWVTASNISRVYNIWPKLKIYSDLSLRCSLYYNYEPNPQEQFTVNSITAAGSSNSYGGSGNYGAYTYYGGNTSYNNVLDLEFQPAIQECQSLSLEFTFFNNGNTIGQGIGLIGVVLEAGAKANRLQRQDNKKVQGS